MASQRQDSQFLKIRRLQFIDKNGRSSEQASSLDIRSKSVTQGVKDLRAMPGSRQDLGGLRELLSTFHGKRKPGRLPRLRTCASKDRAPEPNLSLSIVSKRVFQGNSVKGPEHSQSFVGHTDLLKNSREATAGKTKRKRRTMELLSKAKTQIENAAILLDIRQIPKQEVVRNTEHPSKNLQQQQEKSLGELRRGRLAGEDNTGLIQSQGPFRYCGHLAVEENNFLQGKKIKPYCRQSVQRACPLLVGEQWSGEEPKPVPSGRDELVAMKPSKGRKTQTQLLENALLQGKAMVMGQNVLGEDKSQFLKRKRMQATERLAKTHHDIGLSLENSRMDVQLTSQDITGSYGKNHHEA